MHCGNSKLHDLSMTSLKRESTRSVRNETKMWKPTDSLSEKDLYYVLEKMEHIRKGKTVLEMKNEHSSGLDDSFFDTHISSSPFLKVHNQSQINPFLSNENRKPEKEKLVRKNEKKLIAKEETLGVQEKFEEKKEKIVKTTNKNTFNVESIEMKENNNNYYMIQMYPISPKRLSQEWDAARLMLKKALFFWRNTLLSKMLLRWKNHPQLLRNQRKTSDLNVYSSLDSNTILSGFETNVKDSNHDHDNGKDDEDHFYLSLENKKMDLLFQQNIEHQRSVKQDVYYQPVCFLTEEQSYLVWNRQHRFKILYHCMRNWKLYLNIQRIHQEKVHRGIHWYNTCLMKKMWRALKKKINQKIVKRQKKHAAANYLYQMTLYKSWKCWKSITLRNFYLKEYFLKKQWKTIYSIWKHWKTYCKRKRLQQSNYTIANVYRSRSLMHIFFVQWKKRNKYYEKKKKSMEIFQFRTKEIYWKKWKFTIPLNFIQKGIEIYPKIIQKSFLKTWYKYTIRKQHWQQNWEKIKMCIQQRILRQWKNSYHIRKEMKKKKEIADEHHHLVLQSHCFIHWIEFLSFIFIHREKKKNLELKCHQFIQMKFLNSWKWFHEMTEKYYISCEIYNETLLVKVLKIWIQYQSDAKQEKHKKLLSKQFFRVQLCHRMVTLWKKNCEMKRYVDATCLLAERYYKTSSWTKTIHTWHSRTIFQKKNHMWNVKTDHIIRVFRLERTLTKWCTFQTLVQHRKELQSLAILAYKISLCKKSIQGFKWYRQEKTKKKKKIKHFDNFYVVRLCSYYIKHWKSLGLQNGVLRQSNQLAQLYYEKQCYHSTFQRWKKLILMKTRKKENMKQAEIFYLSFLFYTWKNKTHENVISMKADIFYLNSLGKKFLVQWSTNAARKRLFEDLLDHSLSKLLKTTWTKWKYFTKTVQHQHVLTHKSIMHYDTRQMYQAIQQWHSNVCFQRIKWMALNCGEQHWIAYQLKKSIVHWIKQLQISRLYKRNQKIAKEHYVKRIMFKGMNRWHQQLDNLKYRKIQRQRAKDHFQWTLKTRMIQGWKNGVSILIHQMESKKLVALHYYHIQVSRIFVSWKRSCHNSLLLKNFLYTFQYHQAKKAMTTWYIITKKTKHFQFLLHQSIHKWKTIHIRKIFQQLYDYTQFQKAFRNHQHYVQICLCRKKLKTSWQWFRKWYNVQKTIQKNQTKAIANRKIAMIQIHFHTWHQFTHYWRHVMPKQIAPLRHSLEMAQFRYQYEKWKRYTQHQLQKKKMHHKACLQWKTWRFHWSLKQWKKRKNLGLQYDLSIASKFQTDKIVIRSLKQWRRMITKKNRKKNAYIKAHLHFNQKIKTQGFTTWRSFVLLQGHLRWCFQKSVEKYIKTICQRFFILWTKGVAFQLLQKEKKKRATLHSRHKFLYSTFHMWFMYMKITWHRTESKTLAKTFCTTKLETKYFKRWKFNSTNLIVHAHATSNYFCQKRVFQDWKKNSFGMKLRKLGISRILLKWKNSILSAYFQQLHWYQMYRKAKMEKKIFAFHYFREKSLNKSIRCFYEYRNHCIKMKTLNCHSQKFAESKLLLKIWQQWKKQTLQSCRNRKMIHSALLQLRTFTFSRFFFYWKQETYSIQKTRQLLEQSRLSFQTWKFRKFLNQWWEYVSRNQHLNKAEKNLASLLLKRKFQSWKTTFKFKRVMQSQTNDALSYYIQGNKKRYWINWLDYCRLVQNERLSQNFRETTWKNQYFRKWRIFSLKSLLSNKLITQGNNHWRNTKKNKVIHQWKNVWKQATLEREIKGSANHFHEFHLWEKTVWKWHQYTLQRQKWNLFSMKAKTNYIQFLLTSCWKKWAHWRTLTHHKRKKRQMILKQFQLKYLFKRFALWNLLRIQSKRKKYAMHLGLQFLQSHLHTKFFRIWKLRSTYLKKKIILSDKGRQFKRIIGIQKAFRGWKKVQRYKAKSNLANKYYIVSLKHKIFQLARQKYQHLKEKRQNNSIAQQFYDWGLITQSFQKWKSYRIFFIHLHQWVAQSLLRLKRQALKEWKRVSTIQKIKKQNLFRSNYHWQLRRLQQGIFQWNNFSTDQWISQKYVSFSILHSRKRILSNVMTSWIHYRTNIVKRQHKRIRFRFICHSLLLQLFLSWKEYAFHDPRERVLVGRCNQKLLEHYYSIWCHRIVEICQVDQTWINSSS